MLSRAVSLLRGQGHRLLPAAPIHTTPPSLRRRRSVEQAAAGDDSDGGDFVLNRDPKSPPRLFLVQPRLRPDALLHAKLSEALNLASSLEAQRDEVVDGVSDGKRELPPHLLVQNPAARSLKGRADTYFGPGTVDSVKCHLNAIESEGEVDAVFVNAILSGIQQRNLERAWGRAVLDRVGLIIEIFNAHAQTKEAKLQSELAALMYKRTRLVRVRGPDGRLTFGAHGEAQVVSARGRGSGGQGFMSGAGETELQLQKRRILERRNHLLSQIEGVRRTRALQRAARKRRGGAQGQGLATVAIVGYTNAGKSTLVSSLSDAELYSDDRLFATVDPLLRSVILPSGKKVILSDTVGFISDLPVQLVEAFHATLEEVIEADLLVHVLDSSATNVEEQKTSVLQVLQQIGVPNEKISNMIEVWNKIDLLNENKANELADDPYKTTEESQEDEIGLMDSPFGEIVDEDVNSEHEEQEADGVEPIIDYEQLQSGTGDSYSHQSSHLLKDTGGDLNCQIVGIKRVETSAITGVGLQELLHLIDEKLMAQQSSEKKFYDQKWRPYHPEEVAAVERNLTVGDLGAKIFHREMVDATCRTECLQYVKGLKCHVKG